MSCSDDNVHELIGACCMEHLYEYMWDCEHHPMKPPVIYYEWCKERSTYSPNMKLSTDNVRKYVRFRKRKYHGKYVTATVPDVDTSIHTMNELISIHKNRQKMSIQACIR